MSDDKRDWKKISKEPLGLFEQIVLDDSDFDESVIDAMLDDEAPANDRDFLEGNTAPMVLGLLVYYPIDGEGRIVLEDESFWDNPTVIENDIMIDWLRGLDGGEIFEIEAAAGGATSGRIGGPGGAAPRGVCAGGLPGSTGPGVDDGFHVAAPTHRPPPPPRTAMS